MKKLKRLLSVVLALTMMLSLVVVVSASDYSITITNTEEGITYNAYKIFDATYNQTTESYAYTIASDSPFLTYLQDNYDSYFTFTLVSANTYAVDPDSSFDSTVAAQLAADLKKAIDDGTISATAAATATVATGATSAVLELDEAGYYFVDTSLGSLAFLNSVPGEEGGTQGSADITIVEKNGSPGIDKEVSDDGTTYGDTSDAAIGDTVYYMTTVSDIHNVSNLVIHDYMEAGLTFDSDSVVVYLLPDDSTAIDDKYKLTVSTDYTVTTPGTTQHTAGTDAPTGWTASACTFEVSISHDLTGADVIDDSIIVIYYTATVNEDAEIYVTNESNDNSTYLTYGNASYTELESTQTYVYPLAIYKYSEEGNTKTALEGVKFVLSDESCNYAVLSGSSGVYTLTGFTATDINDATELVTTSDGTILITGLDGETVYYLTETETVDGYNLLSDDIQFKIIGISNTEGQTQGKIYVYDTETTSYVEQTTTQTISSTTYNSIGVLNQKGSELPATGGIGTTIFYVVGGVLILGAVVLLITKRRMGKEDK